MPLRHIDPLRRAHLWVAAGGSRKSAPLAVAVSLAENPTGDILAENHNTDGTTDIGVWQINSRYPRGETLASLHTAEGSARAAVRAYEERGNFTAWSTVNKTTGLPAPKFIVQAIRALGGSKGDFSAGAISDANPSVAEKIARGPVGDTVAAAASPLASLGQIATHVLDPAWWARVGMLAAGVALIGFGLILMARDFAPVPSVLK